MSQTLHQQLVQLRGRAKAWVEGEQDEEFCSRCGTRSPSTDGTLTTEF